MELLDLPAVSATVAGSCRKHSGRTSCFFFLDMVPSVRVGAQLLTGSCGVVWARWYKDLQNLTWVFCFATPSVCVLSWC